MSYLQSILVYIPAVAIGFLLVHLSGPNAVYLLCSSSSSWVLAQAWG